MEPTLAGRVGRYVLLGRVGRGGMGEVHRARAFGAAGVTKELCIKRIRCERLADPASLARFVSEARLSMRLSHANIVSVFDFGRSQGDYYLAMEWVEGCDLRRLLARHEGAPLDEDVALYVGTEIARALAYLHGLDTEGRIAHCDLKPANVLLSRAGEVKLADFGVAAHEAGGLVGGTRRYMAPEQRRSGAIGPAIDLYALGLTIDEMLGGQAARHAPADDASPEAPWPEYQPPATSPALAALLTRLCAEDPSKRPGSAREVADELESLLAEARVRLSRSPRELLAQQVLESATIPRTSTADASDEEELRTDASFLTEGESETFARRMKPDASTRSQSRATPIPPRPPSPSSSARWALLAVLALAVVGVALRSGGGAPASSTPPAPAPVGAPAATSPPPESAIDPVVDPPVSQAIARPAIEAPEAPERALRAVPPSSLATPVEEPAAPPPEPAHLRVNARPWAEVRLDGHAVGITPIIDLELAAGEHDLELVNPALERSETTHLTLAPGERRDVILDLRATD